MNPQIDIQEKQVEPLRVASIRYKGKYEDCGSYFGTLFRKLGRYVDGKPLNLYHDNCKKENDADIETCIPLTTKKEIKPVEGIEIKEIPGGRCYSLLHYGPYSELDQSYAKLHQYFEEHKMEMQLPIREIYIKGPGMIFKGNPKKYITEIQVFAKG